jgi:hypothetical protein
MNESILFICVVLLLRWNAMDLFLIFIWTLSSWSTGSYRRKEWKTVSKEQFLASEIWYSESRWMWSWLMLSAAYCDQIAKAPLAEHYDRLIY